MLFDKKFYFIMLGIIIAAAGAVWLRGGSFFLSFVGLSVFVFVFVECYGIYIFFRTIYYEGLNMTKFDSDLIK